MSKTFTVATHVKRLLSEVGDYRDQTVQVEQPLLILDSCNFHWLELRLNNEVTRIEALREHSAPNRKHEWEWPVSFRIIHDKKGKHTEQVIQRGHRGEGLALIEICGVRLYDFCLTRMMKRKGFIAFSYMVGRQTKTVIPEADQRVDPAPGTTHNAV